MPDAPPTIPAPNLDAIPSELYDLPRWVLWRYEWREGEGGKPGKWTKVPYQADRTTRAKSNAPATWTTLDEAAAAADHAAGWGLGFMFAGDDDVLGVDLDDARDPFTGDLAAWAAEIVATLDSYAEVSPSGAGVHILCRGSLVGLDRTKVKEEWGGVEMYERGRYFTVTGHQLEGTPAGLESRQAQLEAVHARHLARPEPEAAPRKARSASRGPGVHLEDRELLDRAYASKSGAKIRALYDGDTGTHGGDHSAADLALVGHLAWWTDYDRERTDRLFRASDLMRDKWTERHSSDGQTYGEMTLDEAFQGKRPGDGYQPPQPDAESDDDGGGDDPAEARAHEAEAWPEALPLPDDMPRAPILNPELLPEPLRVWVHDIAERASIGLDWLLPGALVSLAATVGNTWRIRPKQHDPWTVVPNLYGVLVIGPGLLKSHALQQTTAPLRRIERQARERYEVEKLRGEVRAERLKAEQEALSDNMKKALRKGNTEEADRLEADLLELKQRAAEEGATAPALVVNDATVERLIEVLRDNPRGVLMLRDELHGWYQSLHKQGRETDRAFFLEAHDGDKSYRQDRIRRGTVEAEIVTLSILGGIQPSRLDAIRRGALDGDEADGLLQRLQVMVWPDELPPYQQVDREPDHEAVGRVETIFDRLYDLDPARFGFEDGEPGVVRFDPDAQALFFDWLRQLEHRVRDPEVQAAPAWASYLGKTRSLMPTLALLLHLVDLVTGEATDVRVSLDAAKRAAELTTYLEGHAAKLYAPELARREVAARRIVERIASGDVEDGVKVRELHRRNWEGLDRDQLERGLALLEELHWLRVEKVPTRGRPTVVLRLRPDILDLADGAS